MLVFHAHQLVDTGLDGGEVGEHAAQPALIDKVHAAALGFFLNGFLGLFLGADEENGVALGDRITDESAGFGQHDGGLFKVDDVDAVTFGEDVVLHPRVPTARLVAEVRSGFEKLFDSCSIRQFS